MAAVSSFKISSLTVNNVLWTPYIVTHTCNNVIFLHAGTGYILLRTDDTDPASQMTIPPGAQLVVVTDHPTEIIRRASAALPAFRFPEGSIGAYFMSVGASDTGPISITS